MSEDRKQMPQAMAEHAAIESTKVGNAAIELFAKLYQPPEEKLHAMSREELDAEHEWRYPATATAIVHVTAAVLAFTDIDVEVFLRQLLPMLQTNRETLEAEIESVKKNAH